MNIFTMPWRRVFKFAYNNISAIDELIDLIEECKNATSDGKIDNDEKSRLMKKYWNLINALKENKIKDSRLKNN